MRWCTVSLSKGLVRLIALYSIVCVSHRHHSLSQAPPSHEFSTEDISSDDLLTWTSKGHNIVEKLADLIDKEVSHGYTPDTSMLYVHADAAMFAGVHSSERTFLT